MLFACNQHDSGNHVTNDILEKGRIPDSLVYEVINFLSSHAEVNPDMKSNMISNREEVPFLFTFKEDSLALTKMDSIFSKKDIEFIFSQKKQFEKFTINPKHIHNKFIISSDSLNNYKSYNTISFPLFNLKKDIIIIRTSYYCGALCGHEGIYLYQKKNTNWTLLKILRQSVY